MDKPISRQELYDAIERQSEHLEKILDRGFDAVTQRMDTANGRTNKLEDKLQTVEKTVAVLFDRATQAETKAVTAQHSAGNSKWWASAIAGAILAIYEAVKALVT